MSHRQILAGLTKNNSVLADRNFLKLLERYQKNPNFIKEENYGNDRAWRMNDMDALVQKAIEEAYVVFNIGNRHAIDNLYAINKEININRNHLDFAMDNVNSKTENSGEAWNRKVEQWKHQFNEIKEELAEIDRSELLSSLDEFKTRFDRDLVTEWLKLTIESNAYQLRGMLIDALNNFEEKATNDYLLLLEAIKDKHNVDLNKINNIPLLQLNEQKLKSIINDIIEMGKPKFLCDTLKQSIKEAGLKSAISSKLSDSKLEEQNKKASEKRDRRSAQLTERIAAEIDIAFDPISQKSNSLIENMKDLLQLVEPLAIKNCQDRVSASYAEAQKLEEEMRALSDNIRPHIIDEENTNQINSAFDALTQMETRLEFVAKSLDSLDKVSGFKEYSRAMAGEIAVLREALNEVRDVHDAVDDKTHLFNELPAKFMNSFASIDQANQCLRDRRINIKEANECLINSEQNIKDARKVICDMRDMQGNLNRKSSLEENKIDELKDNIRRVEAKGAISSVIKIILDNLKQVVENKKAEESVLSVGINKKIEGIQDAIKETTKNLSNIIDKLYEDLRKDPDATVSLGDLLEKISDAMLIHGSKPSIRDKLDEKRYGRSAHMYDKVLKLNEKDLEGSMDVNLQVLDQCLRESKEISRKSEFDDNHANVRDFRIS